MNRRGLFKLLGFGAVAAFVGAPKATPAPEPDELATALTHSEYRVVTSVSRASWIGPVSDEGYILLGPVVTSYDLQASTQPWRNT